MSRMRRKVDVQRDRRAGRKGKERRKTRSGKGSQTYRSKFSVSLFYGHCYVYEEIPPPQKSTSFGIRLVFLLGESGSQVGPSLQLYRKLPSSLGTECLMKALRPGPLPGALPSLRVTSSGPSGES